MDINTASVNTFGRRVNETTPSVPGSMSGMTTQPVSVGTFREQGGGGRLFRVEDYGLGRVWVQDLDSPTGFGWWEDRTRVQEAINAR